MKQISIVIPVYNVEKYISDCLDSVINQSYKNLQIIIVDDGSTDLSGVICDQYAEKDNRITVIHQANAGAGAAKNTGLALVKGDYLSLIDSDDYIELNMYETMITMIEKHNADVVQCLFKNVFLDSEYRRYYNFECKGVRTLSANRFLLEMLYDWKYCIFANKLFKASLLQDYRFPIGRKIDDEFFTYKLICNARRIVNINDCLYNYRMRKTSVMNANDNEKLLNDRLDCYIERNRFISSIFPELSYYYQNELFYYIKKQAPEILKTSKELNITQKRSFIKDFLLRIRTRTYSSDAFNISSNDKYFD